MPQVTLSIPQEKLSLFRELLDVLGIEENGNEGSCASFNNFTDTANAFLKRNLSWENNRNELEFE